MLERSLVLVMIWTVSASYDGLTSLYFYSTLWEFRLVDWDCITCELNHHYSWDELKRDGFWKICFTTCGGGAPNNGICVPHCGCLGNTTMVELKYCIWVGECNAINSIVYHGTGLICIGCYPRPWACSIFIPSWSWGFCNHPSWG